ncbi:hypothetical protein FKM82_012876 [Ascaphus truei]
MQTHKSQWGTIYSACNIFEYFILDHFLSHRDFTKQALRLHERQKGARQELHGRFKKLVIFRRTKCKNYPASQFSHQFIFV